MDMMLVFDTGHRHLVSKSGLSFDTRPYYRALDTVKRVSDALLAKWLVVKESYRSGLRQQEPLSEQE